MALLKKLNKKGYPLKTDTTYSFCFLNSDFLKIKKLYFVYLVLLNNVFRLN